MKIFLKILVLYFNIKELFEVVRYEGVFKLDIRNCLVFWICLEISRFFFLKEVRGNLVNG